MDWIDKSTTAFSKYYIYIIVFTYVLYLSFFIGIVSINYTYLRLFSSVIQFFIALFLIVRFHPFKTDIQLNKDDVRIIYSSGIFLLINLGFTEFIIAFYEDIKTKLKEWKLIQ